MVEPYFSSRTLKFLTALALNNSRSWFELHKADYEGLIRGPALRLIRDFAPSLKKISTHLVASDKKVGGSLMRVHRDTRFGTDKTPFKTNIGIQFRHAAGKDVHAPGLYLHVAPDECFLASGVWHPDSESLSRIRNRIAEKTKAWVKASTDPKFASLFELSGESLARPPRGFDPNHSAIADLKRKDHIALATLSLRDISSSNLVKTMYDRFGRTKPYFRFLCEALALPF
jgi:uncharacterized protein (TIGR02453 family)